jgi:phosphoribosylformylglycinamidine cyclo-ligase
VGTYKESGVDVEKAEGLVDGLKKKFPQIGGYAGVYPLGDKKIAATCDGVGTKIRLAIDLDKHEVVGVDLVAMSVNDLIAGGVKPLFFLDYFSCGKLDKTIFERVLSGIEEGINKAGCILLGGEIAEMPDMYKDNDYDLAGFACGEVLRELKKETVKKNDVIIGLKSNGIHSNGFSLVRKIFTKKELEEYQDMIMRPTEIYSVLINSEKVRNLIGTKIKSMAHVTGGGTVRALKRLLPEGLKGEIFEYEIPNIFKIMNNKGVSLQELNGVFNMGWGMLLTADEKDVEEILKDLDGYVIGRVSD